MAVRRTPIISLLRRKLPILSSYGVQPHNHIICPHGNKHVNQKKSTFQRCAHQHLIIPHGISVFPAQNYHSNRQLRKKQSSALFLSDAISQHTAQVEVELGLDELMSSIQDMTRNLQLRGIDFDMQEFSSNYEKMKKLQTEKWKLETEREKITKSMADIVKQKHVKDRNISKEELISRGKQVKTKLKTITKEWWEVEEKVMLAALKLPNQPHPDTPEEEAVVIDEYREPDKANTTSHIDIGMKHDLITFSNVGPRAYYLKGELAILEQALIDYMSDELIKHNFIPLSCPDVFRAIVVEAGGVDFHDSEQIYRLYDRAEDCDPSSAYYVRGVSPLSFAAFLSKMNIGRESLPLKYFAVGRSYIPRPEKPKLPGLFGALQTMKADLFGVCRTQEDGICMFEEIQAILWEMYKKFELPVRLQKLPVPSLHRADQLRVEIQLWVPSIQDYIKVACVSLIGDYISRRLMIKQSPNTNTVQHGHFVYMVHGEALDSTRLIAALIEYGANKESQKDILPDLKLLNDYWI